MSPTPPTLEPSRWEPVPSARMAIRHYVVAAMKDNTLAGCRVFDSRATPPKSKDQPCIFIHAKDEIAERFQDTPTAYERRLTLWIDIYTEGNEGDPNPADTADAIAAQVEVVMELVQHAITQAVQRSPESLPWSFNPGKSGYTGTSMDQDDEGNQLEAGARVNWSLVYVTEVDEAQLLADKITPFELASVLWDLGADGEIDATDDIRPEQP